MKGGTVRKEREDGKKDRRRKRRKVLERKEIRKKELERRKEGNAYCNDKKNWKYILYQNERNLRKNIMKYSK